MEKGKLIINRFKDAISRAGREHPDSQLELCGIFQNSLIFRMSRGLLIQPQFIRSARISARAITSRKTGVVVTSAADLNSLVDACNRACELSKVMPEVEFAGLPDRPHHSYTEEEPNENFFSVKNYYQMIFGWFQMAREARCQLSGKLVAEKVSVVVVNSRGTEQYYSYPLVEASFIAERGQISGFGSFVGPRAEPYTMESQLGRALSKCSYTTRPVTIEPGKYRVYLEAEAFAEMVDLLSLFSFGAKQVQEKRSFVSDSLGKKLFNSKFTLYDEHSHPLHIKFPFDFEGNPKKKVALVENGTVTGYVYDTQTARAEGKTSTGHALPQPNPHGPAPSHLVAQAGTAEPEDMMKTIDEGILVTRFNYTNIEDQKRGVITGMTRDGTFLIRNGEIVAPMNDLRFTQNVLEALKNIVEIGRYQRLTRTFYSYCVFPDVVIDDFTITGIKKKETE